MTNKREDLPNIVFILSDDQGCWAMGCAGNSEIITPNLDYLAETGMRFENFFCTSPVCSPARASLLTGQIPSQHGVHDWIREGNVGEKSINYLKNQLSYTDILADNGYICGFSGKWHLGDSINPHKGFSHWYVHQSGGGPYYGAPMVKNGQLIKEEKYITDAITDNALNFIENNADDNEPFYISVHYTAPHSPWIDNHPEEIVALYDDCPFNTCPQETKHPWTKGDIFIDKVREDIRGNLKGYFAAVTAMDRNIGRIIKKLEKLGLRDNTLICFLSDNGFNCGDHGFWGKGNGTYPQNMYDTSVKVPAIMSHPDMIEEGVVSDELISGYDFMPTLLDYLYFENPEKNNLPGLSFASLLQGKKNKERENVVIYDEYGPVRMIRNHEWKYVHRYPYGPHELYDLKNDPGERANLINDLNKKKVITSMKAMLDDWFVNYVNSTVNGIREPVTGKGQINLAGTFGEGGKAFCERENKL